MGECTRTGVFGRARFWYGLRMTPRPIRQLVCLALVLAAPGARPAPAAEAPASVQAKPQTVGLIIWGGGAKPEDADAAANDFTTSGLTSSVTPRTVFSTEVRGLKPGFHVAVLGACPADRAHALLKTIGPFHRGAYVRVVPLEGLVAELECPELTIALTPLPNEEKTEGGEDPESGEWKPLVTTQVKGVSAGKYRLRVTLTIVDESTSGEEDSRRWSAVVELRRGATLLESEELSRPVWAAVERFESSVEGVVLETSDMDSSCQTSDTWEGAKVRRLFTIGKGKLVTKVEEEPEFGLCPPNYEGSDERNARCLGKRYDALKPHCEGAESKERCDRAMQRYDAKHARCW